METLLVQAATAPARATGKRKKKATPRVWYTCFCPRCNGPIARSHDLAKVLDARDHHEIATIHDTGIWVSSGPMFFRLRGELDEQGREIEL